MKTTIIPNSLSKTFLATLFSTACVVTHVSAALVFNNGFEGGTNDWSATGGWKPVPANASSSSISREGGKSVRFVPVAGGMRSEFVIRDGSGNYTWGKEYWVGYSLLVIQPVKGFGIISDQHSTPHSVNGVADWNVKSGECSFLLKIKGSDFEIHTATDPSKVFVTPTGSALSGTKSVTRPFVTNTWYDFVLHFNLATNSTGIMEVWMNGEKLVDVQSGPTVYAYDTSGQPKTPVSNQKIGMYYGAGSAALGGEILYDAFRIWKGPGGSYQSVAPRDGTNGAANVRRAELQSATGSVLAVDPAQQAIKVDGETWIATEIAHETFTNATWRDRWVVEGDAACEARDGRLDVVTSDKADSLKAATLWWRNPLPADILIEMTAGVSLPAEDNAANLNLFLHARELDGRPYQFGCSSNYSDYQKIPNYIITLTGGFQPGWSRVRRDPGFAILSEEKSTRSEPGRTYRIRVMITGGRIRYWLDDRLVHDVRDPQPLPGGNFALRTWRSRVWWSDVRIAALTHEETRTNLSALILHAASNSTATSHEQTLNSKS
jgi:hypothetical protein